MEARHTKRTVILTVTNRCNLQCTYCYEALKNNRSMSLETAKEILQKEFAANRGNELQIDFHGGEPLFRFDLIKEACEWAFSERRNCKYIFFIGTNGTLLTQPMKEWFVKHKDRIWLGLSLDGTKEMHDINRSNSFDTIDLGFFRDNWPDQTIKMTISKETLPDTANGVIFAHEHGFKVSFNLAYGINWDKTLLAKYREQMNKLVRYYISHPDIPRAANFDKRLVAVLSKEPLKRHCGAGEYMKAYDTEGNEYPCHMFSGNTLNPEEWQKIAGVNFGDENIYADAECENCPIYRVCPTCYGMNYLERGNIGCRDKRLCEFNKINTLAICGLRYGDLIDKPAEEFTDEDYAELKAVEFLYDALEHDK